MSELGLTRMECKALYDRLVHGRADDTSRNYLTAMAKLRRNVETHQGHELTLLDTDDLPKTNPRTKETA